MSETAARLWLVRHGQTSWNLAGRVQGKTPTDLNETGREQARQLAEYLRGRPFAAIWSSDLPRAFNTAEILAEGRDVAVEQTPILRERDFGVHEGKTADELRVVLGSKVLRAAGKDDSNGISQGRSDLANWTGVPGVESNAQVWVRIEPFLRELSTRYPGQDVLVVTHGGVVARAIYHVMGIPESSPRHFALSNGLVVIVQLRHEAFHLLSLIDYPLAMNGTSTHDTATAKTAD